MQSELKKTALNEVHRNLNARMVDFGGWDLPVQYSGLSAEHAAVRTAAGLFDVSHMGEILIEGPGSLEFLNFLITNDASTLAIHQAQYSAMCNAQGGIVDDLVIYRTGEDRFFLVVNASNTDKDFNHIQSALSAYEGTRPKISNLSSQYTQIALQGPKAESILQKLTETQLSEIQTYWCAPGKVAGIETLIARTGYTGEDGFELYLPWAEGPKVWNAILETGTPEGLLPCGLGARDTLRLEMKYALYGHELSDETNPLDVGLGWVTKLSKSAFVGRDAITQVKEQGPKHKLVGIQSTGRGIPRQGYEIFDESQSNTIGHVTSGTLSPSLKLPIGVAFLNKDFGKIGTKIYVKIRNDFHEAVVVKTPFYQKGTP